MIRKGFVSVVIVAVASAFAACGDGDSTGPSNLNCTGGTALAVGASVNGMLEQGDDADIDGAFLDRYALTVEQGGTIEITMRSSDLDSFLWLLQPDGDVIEGDDDGGGNLDALITRSLNRACYLVEATTFLGQSGAYTLSVQRR